jgi:hypothetical protein
MASAPATDKYGPHRVCETPNCSEDIFELKSYLLPFSAFMGDTEPKSIARTLYFDEGDFFPEFTPKIPIDFNLWESANILPQAVLPEASVLNSMTPMQVDAHAAEDISSPRAG